MESFFLMPILNNSNNHSFNWCHVFITTVQIGYPCIAEFSKKLWHLKIVLQHHHHHHSPLPHHKPSTWKNIHLERRTKDPPWECHLQWRTSNRKQLNWQLWENLRGIIQYSLRWDGYFNDEYVICLNVILHCCGC